MPEPRKAKAKKAKGKGKGKKRAKAAALTAVELESLHIIGSDGSSEPLGPKFRADRFYYRNLLPFAMGLHDVTVRASARELSTRVVVEAWEPPKDAEGGAASGKGGAGKGGKAQTRPKAANAPKGKTLPGKGKGKGKPAAEPNAVPAHLARWLGYVQLGLEEVNGGAAPGEAAGAPGAGEGAPADDTQPAEPSAVAPVQLPAYVLNTVRAEMGRIYDAFRPLARDRSATISRERMYETLHALSLGIGRRDVELLFGLADTQARGEISMAELGAVLRRCRPSCIEEQLRIGRASSPADARAGAWLDEPKAASSDGGVSTGGVPAVDLLFASPTLDGVSDEEPSVASASTLVAQRASLTAAQQQQQQQQQQQRQQQQRQQQPESSSSLVRITLSSHDGSACAHYLVEIRCEQPPATPPPPPELLEPVRGLFEYHASEPPPDHWLPAHGQAAGAAAAAGGPPQRTVGLDGFMSCLRSTHLCAYAGHSRAAFMHANRHKPNARLDLDGFWASLFFAFVRARSVSEGRWDYDGVHILREMREALLSLSWNLDACEVAERNRAAVVANAAEQARKRADQGRTTMQGERWAFKPTKPNRHPHSEGQLDEIPPPYEGTIADDGGPTSVARQAYLEHMQAVWNRQQHAQLWPA
jgi:hypothetical protein